MKPRSKRFEREEQIALLKDCIASNLSIREYAVSKNIGYSTINEWASRQGISLAKEKKKLLCDGPSKTSLADGSPNTANNLKEKEMEGFSFITLADHIKGPAPFPPLRSPIKLPRNPIVLKIRPLVVWKFVCQTGLC